VTRPKSLTILCIILLGLSLFNGLGAYSAYQEFGFLRDLPLSVSPLYLLLRRAFWALVLGVLAIGLWKRQAWGRIGALIAISAYLAQGWLERLWLARADYTQAASLCFSVADLAGLALFWLVLFRPKVRQFFTHRSE